MSDSVPGLSLRIRPRSVPPGVNPSVPPLVPGGTSDSSSPLDAATAKGANSLPDVLPPLPEATPSLLSPANSRPPVPVSFSRPPLPVPAATPPPPPIPAPPPVASAPAGPATDDVAKYKLREAPTFAPPTKAPASTVNATPPPAVLQTSPLLAPRQRPEDSKLFRWGVKVFFVFGVILAGLFLWLGWKFIRDRYGLGSPAAASSPATAKPNTPASAPKQAIDRAKAVVNAVNEINRSEAAPTPAGSSTSSAKPTPAKVISPISALEEYVTRVRVTGVAGGAKPRALLDGVLCYPGQVVDARTGIVFESIDFQTHHLIFRDEAGGKRSLKY